MKALVIDDALYTAEELGIFIQSACPDCDVEIALSTLEGVKQCSRGDFHLVVASHRLLGKEIIQEIKKHFPEIKIVLLTKREVTSAAWDSGADEVWQKPVGIAEIQRGLRRLFPEGGV